MVKVVNTDHVVGQDERREPPTAPSPGHSGTAGASAAAGRSLRPRTDAGSRRAPSEGWPGTRTRPQLEERDVENDRHRDQAKPVARTSTCSPVNRPDRVIQDEHARRAGSRKTLANVEFTERWYPPCMDTETQSAGTDPRVEVDVAERSFTLTRWFDAPRERVWRAWTDPRELAAWWGPHGYTNPVVDADFRPGGGLRIVMRSPEGVDFPMVGEFIAIEPPSAWSSRMTSATTRLPNGAHASIAAAPRSRRAARCGWSWRSPSKSATAGRCSRSPTRSHRTRTRRDHARRRRRRLVREHGAAGSPRHGGLTPAFNDVAFPSSTT